MPAVRRFLDWTLPTTYTKDGERAGASQVTWAASTSVSSLLERANTITLARFDAMADAMQTATWEDRWNIGIADWQELILTTAYAIMRSDECGRFISRPEDEDDGVPGIAGFTPENWVRAIPVVSQFLRGQITRVPRNATETMAVFVRNSKPHTDNPALSKGKAKAKAKAKAAAPADSDKTTPVECPLVWFKEDAALLEERAAEEQERLEQEAKSFEHATLGENLERFHMRLTDNVVRRIKERPVQEQFERPPMFEVVVDAVNKASRTHLAKPLGHQHAAELIAHVVRRLEDKGIIISDAMCDDRDQGSWMEALDNMSSGVEARARARKDDGREAEDEVDEQHIDEHVIAELRERRVNANAAAMAKSLSDNPFRIECFKGTCEFLGLDYDKYIASHAEAMKRSLAIYDKAEKKPYGYQLEGEWPSARYAMRVQTGAGLDTLSDPRPSGLSLPRPLLYIYIYIAID
jgi:hypothetical protein